MADDTSPDTPSDERENIASRHGEALTRRAQSAERKGLEHLERGMFLAAVQSLRDALDTYQQLGAEKHANSAEQYLGLALYEQGNVDEAVEIWEGLVAKGWDRPTTLNFLVRHYEDTGDTDAVERLYSQLAESREKTGGAGFFDRFEAVEGAGTPPIPEAVNKNAELILVADNDPFVRNVLGRLLTHIGYRALLAVDGEEALSVIFERDPDLIFLDVYMPKLSGLDVLYRIRAEGRETPVVVISGRTDATMVRDARVLGAKFAAKPLNFEQLEDMVKSILADDED